MLPCVEAVSEVSLAAMAAVKTGPESREAKALHPSSRTRAYVRDPEHASWAW